MARTRILFVDDEPEVLDEIMRALGGRLHDWDMEWVHGGAEALEAMALRPADVVVSDLRMPGMDGIELLAQVRERWPRAIRLILSGHAGSESVLRAMSVAHQLLEKPLRTDLLGGVLSRAIAVQRMLSRPELLELAGRVGELPSLPGTYSKLIRLIQSPHSSYDDLAEVVERDPLVSARALQFVNSAYFGIGRQVGSVRSAVSLLGPQVLLGMALAATVVDRADEAGIPGLLDEVQDRALRCSGWIRRLLPDDELLDEAVSTALIHDLGTILLALADPKACRNVLDSARQDHAGEYRLEQSALGVTHADMGAYLFGLWGLPLRMVEAIAYHHNPGLIGDGDVTLLAALHGGDVLAACQQRDADPLALADVEILRRGGLDKRFREAAEGLRSGAAGK